MRCLLPKFQSSTSIENVTCLCLFWSFLAMGNFRGVFGFLLPFFLELGSASILLQKEAIYFYSTINFFFLRFLFIYLFIINCFRYIRSVQNPMYIAHKTLFNLTSYANPTCLIQPHGILYIHKNMSKHINFKRYYPKLELF